MPDRWKFAAIMCRNMQEAGLSEARAMQVVCESVNELILEDGKTDRVVVIPIREGGK